MKKHIAKKWVAALRSSKYLQGTGALRSPAGYCCLGVLCDISGLGKWCGDVFGCGPFLHSSVLPPEVQAWAGMRSNNGAWFEGDGSVPILSACNDGAFSNANPVPGYRFTFDAIANFIEKYWRAL